MALDQVHVLRFLSGKYDGHDYPLEDGKSYIAGRSSEADLVLADDAVSRKHARFYQQRGRLWVRDLGSRNGTIVNGQPVPSQCLRPGDRIAFGSSLVKVELVERSAVSKQRAGERADDADAARSMSGKIEEIPLMDVLQWLATSRKTGMLKVRDPEGGRAGSMHLREGQVYYASIHGSDRLSPEKAMIRMLNWSRGSFDLDSSVIENVDQEIGMSLEHVLMEAARQEDEIKNLAKKHPLPGPGGKVQIVKPSPVRWKDLEAKDLEVLQQLFEAGDWGNLLDTSATDDVTLTRSLIALRKRGVVTY
jgi:hypothetical protein